MKKSIKVNKKSILDKIGSVDNRLKEEIQEIQELNESVVNNTIGRKVEDSILSFDIEDTDDEFLVFIKEEINKSNITKGELYSIYDRSEAYNMIYTLANGTLSITRLKKWLVALGKDLVLTTKDIKK